MANDGWGWFDPNTTITPDSGPNMPSPDPAGVRRFNNQGAYLNNLAGLLGGNMPQGGQGQNPLGGLFQMMFGGGRRRRGGGRGYGGGMPDNTNRPPGISDAEWRASGGSPEIAALRAAFQAANGGYTGWGPTGSSAAGFSVDNNLRWNEPILDHGTLAPPGAPRFASPAGMVNANSYNPLSGFAEDAMLWDPTGMSGTGRIQVSNQQLQNQRNWANVPWQSSWADPNASNFYMTAQNLGPTPQAYLNPGTWSWGGGQALDNTTGAPPRYGPPGSPMTQGPQGGSRPPNLGMPGAQGAPPPPYPPGGNGPTGPSGPPAQPPQPPPPAGNFNMYAGMPYPGGMGPYSGWQPPEVGSQVDYGAPGTAPSPFGAAQAAANGVSDIYAPGPTVQPGQYANLGMPNSNWNSAPGFAGGGWGGGGGPWG